ncbi:MAG: hypothetical protein EP302_03385 [Bacteroidetes bacterium]|jgi:hypothetical protein|nr:MAG: hypothetical protein EP302_03385 [Bacteroidota bacterium]
MDKILFGLIFLLGQQVICGQEEVIQARILTDFASYRKHPRQVARVHLNKTVFIKGESLGFQANTTRIQNNFFLVRTC